MVLVCVTTQEEEQQQQQHLRRDHTPDAPTPGLADSPAAAARRQKRIAAQRAQLARLLGDMIRHSGHKRTLFGHRLDSPAAIFNAIDRDKNRTLDCAEFTAGLQRLGLGLSASQLRELLEVSPPLPPMSVLDAPCLYTGHSHVLM